MNLAAWLVTSPQLPVARSIADTAARELLRHAIHIDHDNAQACELASVLFAVLAHIADHAGRAHEASDYRLTSWVCSTTAEPWPTCKDWQA